MKLETLLASTQVALTEGAVIERLRRHGGAQLDPEILNAGLLYSAAGRTALAALYREYLDIGAAADLPLVLGTPTWRANAERVRAAGRGMSNVNGDAARFLAELRAGCGPYAGRVIIGGLLGSRGDAYRPDEALSVDAAAQFHMPQCTDLAEAGVDFLHAATLPALSEARGIARAAARTGVPCVLSFVVRPSGNLLDGTPLDVAIARLDAETHPRPLGYMCNCIHPTVFAAALAHVQCRDPALAARVIGIQANTSALPPEELDSRGELDDAPPDELAASLFEVQQQFHLRVVGGCCGTDARHIRALAERVTQGARPG
jgi:homocysteine S-methyltransferase